MKAAEAKGRTYEEILRNANAVVRRTAAEKRMLETDRTGTTAAFGENPEDPGYKASSQRPQSTDHPWSC